MSKDAVTLCALHSDDMAYIERQFAGSRSGAVSHTGWPAEQVAAFLSQPFIGQHTYSQAHYSAGQFLIIELDGQAIGFFYRFRGPATLNLIVITLLPELQGRGIGSALTGGVSVNGTAVLVGGNIPSSVRSSYISVNFFIAMQGFFPTRD